MEMTRTVKTNVWKLALWTCTQPGDGNTRRVCIVVDSKSIRASNELTESKLTLDYGWRPTVEASTVQERPGLLGF